MHDSTHVRPKPHASERRSLVCWSALPLFGLALLLAPGACSSSDASGSSGSDGGRGQRVPLGKADVTGRCLDGTTNHCGEKSGGSCYCDELCAKVGDCCTDYSASCAAKCTATFRWLQKDAYKETAGRSSNQWPPHTTTSLEITCGGSVVRSVFRENHGTKPAATDANGQVFLVEVAQKQLTGPRADLEALADAYDACECDNEFFSLDGLDDPKVQAMIGGLKSHLMANLTCTGSTDTAGLVELITKGHIGEALAVLPSCAWVSGQDLATGFDSALHGLLTASNQELAQFHVCNNDAKLQAELFGAYAKDKTLGYCDKGSVLCAGPSWLYTPEP